jgi:DNA modification methylase
LENRNFVGIEQEEEYFSIAHQRINVDSVQELAQEQFNPLLAAL